MKSVRYEGAPVNLGRFGNVQKGDVIQVTEAELKGIEDDPDFTILKSRRPKGTAKPYGTPIYDLRSVPWNEPDRILRWLRERGRTTLITIAQAMNYVGADVVITEHDVTEHIVDAVITESRRQEWDQIPWDGLSEVGTIDSPLGEGFEAEEEEEESSSGESGSESGSESVAAEESSSEEENSEEEEDPGSVGDLGLPDPSGGAEESSSAAEESSSAAEPHSEAAPAPAVQTPAAPSRKRKKKGQD